MVILIALLVPNVIGYISSSQKTANLSAAKSIYNAANTCVVNGKASKGNYPSETELANLMNGKKANDATKDSDEGKLVTVPTGTSAIIYYESSKGEIMQVMAASVNSAVDATSGSNIAVYDPTKSGNAYEGSTTWVAPSGSTVKTVKLQNGTTWTTT
jgi:hypothetical protein